MAQALDRLSRLARLDGRRVEAETLARRGLEQHHHVGDVAGLASSLESMGGLAVDGERWQIAARQMAAGRALLDAAAYVPSRREQAYRERDLDRLRLALELGACWLRGVRAAPRRGNPGQAVDGEAVDPSIGRFRGVSRRVDSEQAVSRSESTSGVTA